MDWLTITSYNIDGITYIQTKLSSISVVIADYVDTQEQHFLDEDITQNLLMNLCTFYELHLDHYIKNFIVTQDNPHEKPIITIVDTEDHQSMTGIRTPQPCANYFEWYASSPVNPKKHPLLR